MNKMNSNKTIEFLNLYSQLDLPFIDPFDERNKNFINANDSQLFDEIKIGMKTIQIKFKIENPVQENFEASLNKGRLIFEKNFNNFK